MSTSSARPQPRRGPSSAWSRLRTAPVDPLSAYGLPSKGETRLSDFKTQETYFETIVSRYMKFCASCGTGDKLEQAFASMSLDGIGANISATSPTSQPSIMNPPTRPTQSVLQTAKPPSTSASLPPSSTTTAVQPPSNELPTLLLAMRKLREAITATHRTDAFAQRVYIFVARTTIHPFSHAESYHPTLLYLLQSIHPRTPLTAPELQEFAGYLVLDLACRQGDLHGAYTVKRRYGVGDWKVDSVLRAVVGDNWCLFWRTRRQVDGYLRVLMGAKEAGVRRHALACLGRAYMLADRGFVERSAEREWSELVRVDGVGWELSGDVVTIRKVKTKG